MTPRRPPGWPAAACRREDPELWFPLPSDTATRDKAKAICRACPILDACREWSFQVARDMADPNIGGSYWRLTGIWGGLDEYERAAAMKPHPDCGTWKGSERHMDLGERICPACLQVRKRVQRDGYTHARAAARRVDAGYHR